MKIEQLIVQYLYTNKKVSLQEIGIFYLSPNVSIGSDQEMALPEKAITFEYNIKAVQDDNLIDFIVQQTRKIKPLATSDLESFTILGRQFMNIGKPLPIEGLGILQKNQLGGYEFIQGNYVNPKLEPIPAQLREKNKEKIVFTTPARKAKSKLPIVAAIVIFLLLSAAVAAYFIIPPKDKKRDIILNTTPDKNALSQPAPVQTQPVVPEPKSPDSIKFMIVINEYSGREAANKGYNILSRPGRVMQVYSKDSSLYKLAIPFTNPLSDTTFVKDSLQRLFGSKIYIDLK